ncbi:MAG: histidine--tRNA ligase, partial [Pseudomonadota bacterium]
RVVAQHREALPSPYRRYAVGPVWRNEKPGPGRYRQFYQCDADTVGTPTVAADAEICMMLADALERVGIAQSDVIVRINNRKLLNGILEEFWKMDDPSKQPTADAFSQASLDAILRNIDKFDKVGADGVRELLTEGREDESGAFIEGLGFLDWEVDPILNFLHARSDSNEATLSKLREAVGSSQIGLEGVQELETIAELVKVQGYEGRIVVDPSVVRGLGYYTGPVYEAELTFEITDEDGRKRQFGSVAGGGRYDDLVKRFTGQSVPATGISIGVDRLLAALREIGRAGQAQTAGPVVILPMDKARMADYQTMCAELRNAGIRAEVFLGGGNMAKQLKYADKRSSPIAVIEGGDELASGQVTLKDLALGARLAAEIETRAEWTAQPAQITIPRSDLVAEIRAMLARADGA